MKSRVLCKRAQPRSWPLAQPLVPLFVFLLAGSALVKANSDPSAGLADKSIEELMSTDVTSVSRKEQKLSRVPAAVFVITQADIQRSGATTIPDVLRMAPGVQVQQIDANRWAISVRGFSDSYSNKLLVLVDGRTIYTPAFSGVYWDQLDVPLDTIERIEIVRGPGGTVWGSNAVNGVINIITKEAADTKGLHATTGAGTAQTGDYGFRYGAGLGANASYRAYGGLSQYANLPVTRGVQGIDGWSAGRFGGRLDWKAGAANSFTFDGGAFRDSGSQSLSTVGVPQDQFKANGAHGTATWKHSFSDDSRMSLSLYDTQYSRLDFGTRIDSNLLGLDFQHQFNINGRHDIVWGGGYRSTTDDAAPRNVGGSPYRLTFNPPALNRKLLSGFIQDEIRLPASVSFTVGTKIEHSDFSPADLEPSARLAWLPTGSQTVWLAASKATRLPADFETSFISNSYLVNVPGLQLIASIRGSPQMVPETLHEYEGGYRLMPANNLSIDLTGFRGYYRDVKSLDPEFPSSTIGAEGTVAVAPWAYGNATHAITTGFESDVDWKVLPRWRVAGSYSWLDFTSRQAANNLPAVQAQVNLLDSVRGPGAYDRILSVIDQVAPSRDPSAWSAEHHFNARSYVDLTSKLTLDTAFYYESAMTLIHIPALNRFDAHIGWKVSQHVTLGVSGQNLLTPRHIEVSAINLVSGTQVPRSFSGRAEWNF